ncbi:hypothetical protein C8Q78DRAFT_689740 [Trametes maxima]|nr:hypothetical protein C8Q78DRAFT_689740 [Trametes maxima]
MHISFCLHLIARTVYSCILFHHIYNTPVLFRIHPPLHVHVSRNALMFRPRSHSHAHVRPSSPRLRHPQSCLALPGRPRRRGERASRSGPASSHLPCSCSPPPDRMRVGNLVWKASNFAKNVLVKIWNFWPKCPEKI